MKNIFYNSEAIESNDMLILWELLLHNNDRKVLAKITKYINQRYDNYERWIGALKDTNVKTLILWADKDPVAVIEMAYKLSSIIKNSTLNIIENVGHYPMVEATDEWTNRILDFYNIKEI